MIKKIDKFIFEGPAVFGITAVMMITIIGSFIGSKILCGLYF